MTRASDTAKLLGAGATILDGTTISTADNTDQLTLTSTDADANNGPNLRLYRNSSSPANSDLVGNIDFEGRNNNSQDVVYGSIEAQISDLTDNAEHGSVFFKSMIGGTLQERFRLNDTSVVFNEGSIDSDFRVESNGNTHMLFVDAGNDRVGIGTNSVSEPLRVQADSDTDFDASGAEFNRAIMLKNSTGGAANCVSLAMATESNGEVFLTTVQNSSNDAADFVISTRDSGARAERMRLVSTGRLLVGGIAGNSSDEALQVYRNGNPGLSVARQQDGTIVHFRVGAVNGAAHGSISISGVTCSYNAFSGSHWSRLSDNSKPTILKGTIIETIDEMCDWYQAEFTVEATTKEDTDSESETFGQQIEDVAEHIASKPIELPNGGAVGDTISVTINGITYDNAVIAKEGDEKHVKCKISDTADSKKVYGVHAAWDNDDDTVNDMYVTAVGTHVVRINKDVTVSAGDLLSSNGDGTAKVQDDDIIRSKTLGKVLTNLKQETYSDGSYTVPCALYCG